MFNNSYKHPTYVARNKMLFTVTWLTPSQLHIQYTYLHCLFHVTLLQPFIITWQKTCWSTLSPRLHKARTSIHQQHLHPVSYPANAFVFTSSKIIFYVKVHHTKPANPLESISPDKCSHWYFLKGGYKADLFAACANCALHSVSVCGPDESQPNSPGWLEMQ